MGSGRDRGRRGTRADRLLDRACLEAVEEWKHLGIGADAAALLLARVDTPGDSGAAEAAAIAATMTDAGSLALQAAVRRALDPREVFNPGKG